MKWRRFAIASGILAFLVLAGWWWQGLVRQREAWGLVRKALQFQQEWVVTGQARWAFREMQGRWVERQGRISLSGQTLQVHGQGAELVCRLAGCQLVTKGMTSLRIVPVSAQRLPHAPDRWSLLRRSYRVRLDEASEVAGRFVQWVQLAPRSPSRFSQSAAAASQLPPHNDPSQRGRVGEDDGDWRMVGGKRPFAPKTLAISHDSQAA